jgi:hypothetical protein
MPLRPMRVLDGKPGCARRVSKEEAAPRCLPVRRPSASSIVDGFVLLCIGSGGAKGDPTQGVFLAAKGATTATAIDNSTDTRVASIFNTGTGNTLYVSRDFNPPNGGTQNFTNVSSLINASGGLPTSSADDHLAAGINAVNLENRLGDV